MPFQSSKFFPGVVTDLAPVARGVMSHFRSLGYEITGQPTANKGWHISLSKGDTFEAIMGTKTALNIELEPVAGGVMARAGVGLFGLQAIPTAISFLVFWPVRVTQIWGLIEQSRLDDQAMAVIEKLLAAQTARPAGPPTPPSASPAHTTGSASRSTGSSRTAPPAPGSRPSRFCSRCGAPLTPQAKFCSECGTRLASG